MRNKWSVVNKNDFWSRNFLKAGQGTFSDCYDSDNVQLLIALQDINEAVVRKA